MESLSEQHCVPCEGGVPTLTEEEIEARRDKLPEWRLNEDGRLERDLKLKDFMSVIDLVNQFAEVAEGEGHHPDLSVYDYNRLKVTIWTHAIKGLSQNDFILAAKFDRLVDA